LKRWKESAQKWVAGYFVLRGQRDWRDLVCVDAATNGAAFAWWGRDGNMVVNGSISYRGALMVVGAPKGSQWSLTLSDVPNPRTPTSILASATG
jgi:hypothetical protein